MLKIKVIFAFLLLAATLICLPVSSFAGGVSPDDSVAAMLDGISVSAKAAAVIEASTGQAVYLLNADEELPMASTTKIMTALVVLDNLDPTQTVTVPAAAVNTEGSSAYLAVNEEISVKSLLYAMMLQSANDAAEALALNVSGSIEDFAGLMNAKAAELGLEHTHFINPHGLDAEDHYTSASDLAKLTAYALKNPLFKEIVSTKKYTADDETAVVSRMFVNHNRLLNEYEGAVGVKTGYTKSTGRCLVSAAERDGITLIAVTLNDPDDWKDHKKLLDSAFEICSRVELCKDGSESFEVPVINGRSGKVKCVNKGDVTYVSVGQPNDTEKTVEIERFLYAPVSKGERVGRIIYKCGGNVVGESEIVAVKSVKSISYPSFFDRILIKLGIK